MSYSVKNVIMDKIFISKIKTKQSGIILSNETPLYKIEKISNNISDYINIELKENDIIIIKDRSMQFAYNENGIEYFYVRAGDVICVVEEYET